MRKERIINQLYLSTLAFLLLNSPSGNKPTRNFFFCIRTRDSSFLDLTKNKTFPLNYSRHIPHFLINGGTKTF